MSLNKPIYKLLDWIDINHLDWDMLSLNKNAISIIEENPEEISCVFLSENKNAIKLLEENLYEGIDNIDWESLSLNHNAIKLLKNNPDYIDWDTLSNNKNAIKILEENPDKINWKRFSENSSIFELNYEKMRENNQEMYEDLIKEVMKPSRVFKNPDYDYLEELFGD